MYIVTIGTQRFKIEAPNDVMARVRLAEKLELPVRDLPEHELYKMDE